VARPLLVHDAAPARDRLLGDRQAESPRAVRSDEGLAHGLKRSKSRGRKWAGKQAGALVLVRHAKMAPRLLGAHAHGRLAVAERIGHEVREDAVSASGLTSAFSPASTSTTTSTARSPAIFVAAS
jgi:hypothetical protein